MQQNGSEILKFNPASCGVKFYGCPHLKNLQIAKFTKIAQRNSYQAIR
ncbi:hypothetical protein CAMGR0001_0864 [Campylobacter gracilis RM3268]|uniref:Uncharacterized protein n=1 Tax=Campylobacter gracilis RM3268 TaxID=553220 RepID=C8PG71_9BACT|nr:hypothetical protein CAMGR0001_0864 [Campylobacter gracilis RM3268]